MKSLARPFAVLATVFALGLAASTASADVPPEHEAPRSAQEERAASFQAVSGAQAENVPGGPLLLGAYALVWLLTMGYVFRVGRLEAKLSADVEALARQIEEASRTKGV